MAFTPEEKKLLKMYSNILEKFGVDKSYYSFFFGYGYSEYDSEVFQVPYNFSNIKDSIPTFNSLTILAKKIYDEMDLEQYIDDESKWQEIRLTIIPSKKIIEIKNLLTFTETNESEHVMTFEEMSEEQIEGFEKMKLECDCKSDSVNFNGGGDDGYIESKTTEDNDIDGRIEDLFYRMLNDVQSGWEIDEGSQGNFILNYKKNIIILNFGLNVDKDDSEEIATLSFD